MALMWSGLLGISVSSPLIMKAIGYSHLMEIFAHFYSIIGVTDLVNYSK